MRGRGGRRGGGRGCGLRLCEWRERECCEQRNSRLERQLCNRCPPSPSPSGGASGSPTSSSSSCCDGALSRPRHGATACVGPSSSSSSSSIAWRQPSPRPGAERQAARFGVRSNIIDRAQANRPGSPFFPSVIHTPVSVRPPRLSLCLHKHGGTPQAQPGAALRRRLGRGCAKQWQAVALRRRPPARGRHCGATSRSAQPVAPG